MLKRSFIKPFALCVAVFGSLLTGCASTDLAPLQLQLPQLAAPTSVLAKQRVHPQAARLVVVDQRPQHHALRLHQGSKPAQFATLETPITTLIRQQLAPYIHHQADHPLLLQLTVDQGLCIAEQSFSRHSMNCTLVLQVSARVPAGSWAKTYTSKRRREGKFSLNTNYIQDDISAVVNSALTDFNNDPEFYSWLNTYIPNAAHVIKEASHAF